MYVILKHDIFKSIPLTILKYHKNLSIPYPLLIVLYTTTIDGYS